MKLSELAARGYVESIPPSKDDLANLIRAIQRRLMDAQNPTVTKENRLQQAYQAILQVAIAALLAHGYRLKSKPAHHVMALDSLEHTLGIDRKVLDYYQSLRKRRHHAIYDALITVSETDLEQAIEQAQNLAKRFRNWLEVARPDMVSDAVWHEPVSPG